MQRIRALAKLLEEKSSRRIVLCPRSRHGISEEEVYTYALPRAAPFVVPIGPMGALHGAEVFLFPCAYGEVENLGRGRSGLVSQIHGTTSGMTGNELVLDLRLRTQSYSLGARFQTQVLDLKIPAAFPDRIATIPSAAGWSVMRPTSRAGIARARLMSCSSSRRRSRSYAAIRTPRETLSACECVIAILHGSHQFARRPVPLNRGVARQRLSATQRAPRCF